MTIQATIGFAGEHAHIASKEEMAAGLDAANRVFLYHRVDPLDCAVANQKLGRDELLTKEEAVLCVIWGEAEEAAFHSVTLGWLVRDIDIRLVLQN